MILAHSKRGLARAAAQALACFCVVAAAAVQTQGRDLPADTPLARRLDEFGAVPCGDELARLDNFIHALSGEPHAQGYIVIRGGWRRGKVIEARSRSIRMMSYMVYRRGIEYERVAAVDSGGRGELNVGLWIVPPGAAPPDDAAARGARTVRLPRGRRRPPDCEDVYATARGSSNQ
jgi:hypothetical protein